MREAIAKQNEQAKKENRPEIPSDQLVALAEELLPRLRAAEWLDKAQAALADIDVLDLRDLRSVVVAADRNTRDDESKALLDQLQAGLTRRIDEEQTNWVSDIAANLDAGRFVRALRSSPRFFSSSCSGRGSSAPCAFAKARDSRSAKTALSATSCKSKARPPWAD